MKIALSIILKIKTILNWFKKGSYEPLKYYTGVTETLYRSDYYAIKDGLIFDKNFKKIVDIEAITRDVK